MATLARSVGWFSRELAKRLPDAPDQAAFDKAVADVVKLRAFRPWSTGLLAMAKDAYQAEGHAGIQAFLARQAVKAEDLDARDNPNFKENNQANGVALGPLLGAAIRRGKEELTVADSVQAFALEHGIPVLTEAVKARYKAPAQEAAVWVDRVRGQTTGMVGKEALGAMVTALAPELAAWRAQPDVTMSRLREIAHELDFLARDLRGQPGETCRYALKELGWLINRTPAEFTITATLAVSGYIVAQACAELNGVADVMKTLGYATGGWFIADVLTAAFHWQQDNYPQGRVGREFQRHHSHPTEVSEWPLSRNADVPSQIALPTSLAAALLPSDPYTVLLVTTIIGLMFAQHIHGYAHRRDKTTLPPAIRLLQKARVLLPWSEHKNHHGKPVGSGHYGILNGWSNPFLDESGFFRHLEGLREKLTGKSPEWRDALAELEKRRSALKAR